MTKTQLRDFEAWGEDWAAGYCDDHNCKREEIPLKFAVETAEFHIDNLEHNDISLLDDEEKKDYQLTKQFYQKYKNRKAVSNSD